LYLNGAFKVLESNTALMRLHEVEALEKAASTES
jgi:hypothetical protein